MSEYREKQKEKMKAECEGFADNLIDNFIDLCYSLPFKPTKIANVLCDAINKTLHAVAKGMEEDV